MGEVFFKQPDNVQPDRCKKENSIDLNINNQDVFDRWYNADGMNAYNNPSVAICVDVDTGIRTCHLLCTDYLGIRGETLAFFDQQKKNLERDISQDRKRSLRVISFWWRDGNDIKHQDLK